jgi:hypothetical protein
VRWRNLGGGCGGAPPNCHCRYRNTAQEARPAQRVRTSS